MAAALGRRAPRRIAMFGPRSRVRQRLRPAPPQSPRAGHEVAAELGLGLTKPTRRHRPQRRRAVRGSAAPPRRRALPLPSTKPPDGTEEVSPIHGLGGDPARRSGTRSWTRARLELGHRRRSVKDVEPARSERRTRSPEAAPRGRVVQGPSGASTKPTRRPCARWVGDDQEGQPPTASYQLHAQDSGARFVTWAGSSLPAARSAGRPRGLLTAAAGRTSAHRRWRSADRLLEGRARRREQQGKAAANDPSAHSAHRLVFAQ